MKPVFAFFIVFLLSSSVLGEDKMRLDTGAANPGTPESITHNETADLPILAPAKAGNFASKTLLSELAPFHPKIWLLPEDPDAALNGFQFNSVQGEARAEKVMVAEQNFHNAFRIETVRKPQEWMTFIQSFRDEPVKRGDVLYATAWARAIALPDGKAQGQGRLYASLGKGNSIYAKNFNIPMQWTRLHFAMVANRDLLAPNQLQWMFTFGHTPQTIEFGGIQAANLGPGVDKAKLPYAKLELNYPGRESNAKWRRDALARIEKIRKGDLKIEVVDERGKPLKGAKVEVTMKRHAFLFGSGFPFAMLPPQYQKIKPINDDFKRTAGASSEDKARIQAEFLRLFNGSTVPLVWGTWDGLDDRISQDDIRGGLRWFAEKGIPIYNAQAVYPSPEFTPKFAQQLLADGKKDEFRSAVKEFVTLSATGFSPPIRSLQIANEIESRPQYTNLLGHDSVPEWFEWAKAANPKMETEVNGPYRLGETSVQTTNRGQSWPESEGLQFHFDFIAWLLKNKAPIDAIGIQNHASIGAPGPEAILKSLDAFATFGKPLEVTEYEMSIQNGADTAQRQYQADYTRDFFIAVFSHPSARMIMLQDFWQPAAWQYDAASAFFNKDWSLNPHGQAYEDLVLKKWWTDTEGKTDKKGIFQTRGFLGDYGVRVSLNGKTQTVQASLPKNGASLKIVLR